MENNNQQKSGFTYTYSAKEQAELKRIREKYTEAPKSEVENKMERLRRLDASVTQTAQIVALVVGIVGALTLGFGMSLCMTELREILGPHKDMAMFIGITVGIFGGALASFAYPVYNFLVKRKREKIAPEIIHLTDELMK